MLYIFFFKLGLVYSSLVHFNNQIMSINVSTPLLCRVLVRRHMVKCGRAMCQISEKEMETVR